MKTFLVVNPRSGNGQTGKRWTELSAQLQRGLGDFSHAFTERPMHAVELTARALDQGFELVVAVGGDGTINEVTNAFFDGERARRPDAALGVLPRGTGGDFRRTFGWDDDVEAAIARFRSPDTKAVDVGRVELEAHGGGQLTRYFINVCSFGISGQVDAEVNKSSKALGGRLSFMVGTLKAFAKYSDRKIRFSVDGGPTEEAVITTLAVGNGQYFGGGMRVTPGGDPTDGSFAVTLWSGYRLTDFVLKQKAIYDGSHTRFPGTRTLTCKTLSATAEQETLVDVDGEQPGKLPCTITVVPGAIRLKV